MMKKHNYIKPKITMVALRVEERLAECDPFDLSSHPANTGCTVNRFPATKPNACTGYDTLLSLS